jgi:hypothetical protein
LGAAQFAAFFSEQGKVQPAGLSAIPPSQGKQLFPCNVNSWRIKTYTESAFTRKNPDSTTALTPDPGRMCGEHQRQDRPRGRSGCMVPPGVRLAARPVEEAPIFELTPLSPSEYSGRRSG